MKEPEIAQYKPYHVQVEQGRHYLWCSCGLSQTQPFCDKSHVGTEFKPVPYTAEKSCSVLFCGCKHTLDAPLCDGSHNNLVDEYATDERSLEQLMASTELVEFDADGRAQLDNDCYVQQREGLRFSDSGKLSIAPVITHQDNAKFIAQYAARFAGGSSDIFCYPDAEVVLYGTAGEGQVNISGEQFKLSRQTGALIRRGEAFQLENIGADSLEFLITVCPGQATLNLLNAMPANFNQGFPCRTGAFDESQKKTMADRFYQVLIGEEKGSKEVSAFIGEVPQSKAAPHRHLYEEAILILAGYGTMWTDTKRARVKAGDLIFLPARQEHSLQCESAEGMALAGHFYPSGEPNINY